MKRTNNVANPYSFYTFNQTDIFYDDENENSIISDISHNAEQVYVYEHYEILQEYCFVNENTYLYRKFGDDKLALLYEREQDENGVTNISIYNCNTFYTSKIKSGESYSIVSMNAKDFLFFDRCLRYYIRNSNCETYL